MITRGSESRKVRARYEGSYGRHQMSRFSNQYFDRKSVSLR